MRLIEIPLRYPYRIAFSMILAFLNTKTSLVYEDSGTPESRYRCVAILPIVFTMFLAFLDTNTVAFSQ